MSDTSHARRPHRLRRTLLIIGAGLIALVAIAAAAFQLSPWPSVLLLRGTGDDGLGTAAGNEQFVPEGIDSKLDLAYGDSPDDRLDVFRPADQSGPLPTVVWVHGGGFIGGIKEPLRPYLKILAAHGFTTVNVEYSHSPEAEYPTPVRQLSAALAYITEHADELGVDRDQIVLGGDSAGAHIAGQTAIAIVDDGYAKDAGLPQAIPADALRATALFSGPFDTSVIDSTEDSKMRWFMQTVMWSYTGSKGFAHDPEFAAVSLVDHVPSGMPPTFVSTGPYDPLLPHSLTMVDRLQNAGVEVDSLFFEAEDTPSDVGHEYALTLSSPQGKEAMKRLVAFLHAHVDGPELAGPSTDW